MPINETTNISSQDSTTLTQAITLVVSWARMAHLASF